MRLDHPATFSSLAGACSVLVVMAVYHPEPRHLRAQMASLAEQKGGVPTVLAVIADLCSSSLVRAMADELRLPLILVEPEAPLDAIHAFEKGLNEALTWAGIHQRAHDDIPLIALCDQDDIWHPERLSQGIEKMAQTGAALVHSDARLVDAHSECLHSSMFAYERRQKNPGLRGLLLRNTITGMTVLMRPDVLRMALPFPPQSGVHFYHDLWLGMVAHALEGGVAFIPKSLVDYRQHAHNAVGAVERSSASGKLFRLPNAAWLRREGANYALARYLAQSLHARITAISPERLHDLRPLWPFLRRTRGASAHLWDALRLSAKGQFKLARISAGFAVINVGRFVWAMREGIKIGRNQLIHELDSKLYSLSPGVAPRLFEVEPEVPKPQNTTVDAIVDRRKTPNWVPVFNASVPALTILVPTLNPSEIFAGIATALDIGVKLAEKGVNIRFIATDLPVSSPSASMHFLHKRIASSIAPESVVERISLECGVSATEIPAHKDDHFMATAWWSAHVADHLMTRYGFHTAKFTYLIQDFEPNFYAWGQEFADAMASYDLHFTPLFNTSLLRDYFAMQGYGFASDAALAFHPSIDISRYQNGARVVDSILTGPRKLALYGRPEVERNMYPMAVEALARFIEAENLGPSDIELVSVGLKHRSVNLPNGLVLKSLGKLPWDEYPKFLLGTDLGLSLMYSPHPSHTPIEMAASGVRVVSNRFGPKDLSSLSTAILSADPTTQDLACALSKAWHAPPVSAQERDISLTSLGMPMEDLIAELFNYFRPLVQKTS